LKLEGEYKAADLKLEIAKDSNYFTLEAADAVVHDLLIAVFSSFVCCFLAQYSKP
jgi:HAE1 family hydrophobic/amphiphilic exporter-1